MSRDAAMRGEQGIPRLKRGLAEMLKGGVVTFGEIPQPDRLGGRGW